METTQRNAIWRSIANGLLISSIFLFLPSCSVEDDWLNDDVNYKELAVEGDLYYGPETFTIQAANTPINETRTSLNSDYECFDGIFTLKVQNGSSNKTKVSHVEIKIDGNVILNNEDFKKKVTYVERPINLTAESILEVYLKGPKDSFIELLIEGTSITIVPTFEQIPPFCGGPVPALPLSSTNTPPITGTWDPPIIYTGSWGRSTYTFTPDEGQCATTTTMSIVISPGDITLPTPQIGPLLQNSVPPELPTFGNVTGTWNPATINTSTIGSFWYWFDPE